MLRFPWYNRREAWAKARSNEGGADVIRFRTKVILADREMTQRQLWEATGIRPPTISAMCTGSVRQIPVDVLNRMCKVLNCQPGDLLEYEPDQIKEETKMASRVYFRGTEVGEVMAIEAVLAYVNGSDYTDEQTEKAISAYRSKMHDALTALDDRLWWQPETGEVFWEDDGSGKPLPYADDPDGFIDWWNETAGRILADVTK